MSKMKFIPHDVNTYLVRSRTRPGHHIVDVMEMTCSCEGFQFYNTCAHVQAALRHFGISTVVNTTVTVDCSQFL